MKRVRSISSWRRVAPAVMAGLILALGTPVQAQAPNSGPTPAVQVSLRFDRPAIAVGEKTILRVLAEIVPGLKSTAAQIFSWHVDLVAEFAAPVDMQVTGLERSASDRDPQSSSGGAVDGSVLRGVYDTFIGRTDAGLNAPVELFSVPVVGVREGTASFRVRPGTGPTGLSGDFLVAGISPDASWMGGDYVAAAAALQVGGAPVAGPTLSIRFEPSSSGGGGTVVLEFAVLPGRTYAVQSSESLGAGASWRDLAGAPHQSGRAVDTIGSGARFYRVAQR